MGFFYFTEFLERKMGEDAKRERERRFLYVPCPGIKPATLVYPNDTFNQLSHPVRALMEDLRLVFVGEIKWNILKKS